MASRLMVVLIPLLIMAGTTLKIYQLDHNFRNGACFYTIFEDTIVAESWEQAIMSMAAAMITLKVNSLFFD